MASRERNADNSSFATTWTVDNTPYVILKWTIENLCYAETLLKSPCFEISQTSKWNLLLNPKLVIQGDDFVGIYLKKNDCVEARRFMLKGELSVHGPRNELLYDKMFDEIYDENNSIEFRLSKVVLPPVLPSFDDSYLVRCEMVITCEIRTVDATRPHLQKLSSDFKKLYYDNKFTDISIIATDDIIHSHKAFLHARSPLLAKKLEANVTYLAENNEKDPYLAVVLLFLYTGNPDLLLSSVPFEMVGKICKIAKKWQLNELVNLLTPLKMHCKTHIKNESFQYTWEIKNFTKLNAESSGILHSSEFSTKEDISAKWRLTIEKKLRDGAECYGLYLEKMNTDNISYKTNTEFKVYNSKGNSVFKSRRYIFGPRANQKCGFSSLFNRNFVKSSSPNDDILKVVCILKIHLDSDSWIDFKSTSVDVSDKDTCFLKYLKMLSSNFKELYETQKYADLKLFTGKEMTKVHKAILWARSPYFEGILNQSSVEYIAVEVQHDILKQILLYIYTADLPTLSILNMQKLYVASLSFKLEELFSVCKSYMLLHITVDNVLEIMVLAHTHKDKELENAAEKFASTPGNAKMFLNTQRWRTFRENHVNLAIKIYHNLSWSFCNYF